MKLKRVWRTLLLLLTLCLMHDHATAMPDDLFTKGVTVDLRNPEFSDNVLRTTCGGVVQGPDIRVQAQNIVYTRKIIDGTPVFTIEAEGDLMLEIGEYIFVGTRLDYDFQKRSGILYEGRTAAEPWFFGGEEIHLRCDGSYLIYNGFLSTSENRTADWQITCEKASLVDRQYVAAKNVQFRIAHFPIFWIPSFKMDFDSIFDAPIRFWGEWGGRQGTRGGLAYEIFSWRRWKTSLLLDYRIKRGPGGGFETSYKSEDHREILETVNYIARDSAVTMPHERTRYRFQGIYSNLLLDDRVSVDLTWDKLSDKDMATDFKDNGLELDVAGRTQLLIRSQEDSWITNFLTRIRANNFQTVKQELPTLETTWRPVQLGSTGIITDNRIKLSYLDFEYANKLANVHDYNSGRVEVFNNFYRPVVFKNLTLLPEAGSEFIYYNNSPQKRQRWLVTGLFGCEALTTLYRTCGHYKHVIQPYAKYSYFTSPTASPHDHYIFDIDDGWYRLNTLRVGCRNNLYMKNDAGCIHRLIGADLYTNAFFNTPTIGQTIPRVNADLTVNSLPTLRHTFGTAWNFEHGELDYFNVRTDWTVNQDFAVAAEYRHRGPFDWRKVDYDNYILDSYRSEKELRRSQLSDRRDTFLIDLFYRFHHSLAVAFEARHGWRRQREPSYTEYEVDLLATLKSAWNIKLSYQHKECDRRQDRIAIYFTIGLRRPDQQKCENIVPCLEF